MTEKKSIIWKTSFRNMDETFLAPILLTRDCNTVCVHDIDSKGVVLGNWIVRSPAKGIFRHIDDFYRLDFYFEFPGKYPNVPSSYYLRGTDTVLGLNQPSCHTYVLRTEESGVEIVSGQEPQIEPVSTPLDKVILAQLATDNFGLDDVYSNGDTTSIQLEPQKMADLKVERLKLNGWELNELRFLFFIFILHEVYVYVRTSSGQIIELWLSDYQFQRTPVSQPTDAALLVADTNEKVCDGIWKVWGSKFFKEANIHDRLYMDIQNKDKRHTLFIATDVAHFEFSCTCSPLYKITHFSSPNEYKKRVNTLLKTKPLGP